MTAALEHLWAGWRMAYIAGAAEERHADGCVFCRILASSEGDEAAGVVWRGPLASVLLNAFPYASGHVIVVPNRHAGNLEDLGAEESAALWGAVTDAVVALKAAYSPEGLNVGANLGRAAGAGLPEHLHAHVVPRWNGDTNFMTTLAAARVLPEDLPTTWRRLREAWPR